MIEFERQAEPASFPTSRSPEVRAATFEDRDRAIQLITLGFAADPVARWIWPEARDYLLAMPQLVSEFGRYSLEHETTWMDCGCRSASIWLPAGVSADQESIDRVLETTTRSEIAEDVGALFAQMASYHPEGNDVWYLPMIATDPVYRGRGTGGALLAFALARCDEQGASAYLESSNPRNIPFYERHGFSVVGEIQVGASPPLFPMFREATGSPGAPARIW